MLRKNDSHIRLHTMGPKQCSWKGSKRAVTSIQVVRSTMDSEQVSIACPIFDNDTREEVSDRLGMLMSVVQDRMDDIRDAMIEAQESEENSKAAHDAELAKILEAKKNKKG